MRIFEYVSDLDVRSRSVPPPFLVRFKSVSSPFPYIRDISPMIGLRASGK